MDGAISFLWERKRRWYYWQLSRCCFKLKTATKNTTASSWFDICTWVQLFDIKPGATVVHYTKEVQWIDIDVVVAFSFTHEGKMGQKSKKVVQIPGTQNSCGNLGAIFFGQKILQLGPGISSTFFYHAILLVKILKEFPGTSSGNFRQKYLALNSRNYFEFRELSLKFFIFMCMWKNRFLCKRL